MKSIGTFEIKSGKVVVTDPCYEINEKSTLNKIINVKNGTWNAYICEGHSTKVCALLICHKDSNQIKQIEGLDAYTLLGYTNHITKIGVDSGQAGFFDINHFKNDDDTVNQTIADFIDVNDLGDKWYAMCCHLTCNTENSAGVVPYGVVAQSGYGDGRYNVYADCEGDDKVSTILQIEFAEQHYDSDSDD